MTIAMKIVSIDSVSVALDYILDTYPCNCEMGICTHQIEGAEKKRMKGVTRGENWVCRYFLSQNIRNRIFAKALSEYFSSRN